MRKVVGLAVALLFARPAVSATTFASLGDLGGPTLDTSVIGLSADGRVAVGSADTTNPLGGTAFRWEDGVIAGLGTTGWGSANAASTDGGVVVGDHWRWDHGVVTTVLDTDGNPVQGVTDVSADGSVMVGVERLFGVSDQGFRTSNGSPVLLELPPGATQISGGRPVFVSADGSVIVASAPTGVGYRFAPFRWQNGQAVWLPRLYSPSLYDSSVTGISADGSVIVGTDAGIPVYWKDGQVVQLPILFGLFIGEPQGVSADGSVIVGMSGNAYATLWLRGQPHQIFDLLDAQGVNLTGWVLGQTSGQASVDVSDDGLTIVGTGTYNGAVASWIAHFDRCSNGLDDDGDGLTDYPNDPGCQSATSSLENPKCDDDLDNDGDGGIDWDGGADGSTPDPQCTAPWKNREGTGGCGLGAELVGALGALLVGRRRILR